MNTTREVIQPGDIYKWREPNGNFREGMIIENNSPRLYSFINFLSGKIILGGLSRSITKDALKQRLQRLCAYPIGEIKGPYYLTTWITNEE